MSQRAPRNNCSPVVEKRRIVIITGLSGAGKSNALQAFEDAGYFCIDNLPPRMIPAVMETAAQGNGGPDGVVVVMDIRGRRYFGGELERSLENVEESDWERRILFVESDDRTLVRRYTVSLISFGFKHGTPLDVDTIFDVRFMPNPHYDPELRPLTGHDAPVREAVLGQDDAREFLEKASDMLSFLIPRYAAEGKTYFTLGVGCTGGRHRSVVIVEELAWRLRRSNGEVDLFVRHRDLES